MTRLSTRFVRVKEASHAHVCKDVLPKYQRGNKKIAPVPVSSKDAYQKIVLRIPDEYAFALMEMYEGKGLQGAIMKHLRKTVTPINLDGEEK